MKRIYFVLSLIILLSSCKFLLMKKYKFNRPFTFSEHGQYFKYLKDKMNIDSTVIIYPDKASTPAFMYKMASDSLNIYYGCFVNDSTEVKQSSLLKENLSCIGRVISEIRKNSSLEMMAFDSLVEKSSFAEMRFKYLVNDSLVHFNSNNKKLKLILVYNYMYGTYYNSFFSEVMNYYYEHKDILDLYIITLDAYAFKSPKQQSKP